MAGQSSISGAIEGMAESYGAAAPMASMVLADKQKRRTLLKVAVFITATIVAVACGVLLAMEHRGNTDNQGALSGAYYAVTKPPAFNFNSKFACR